MLFRSLLVFNLGLAAAGVCNDKSTDCGGWARDGECEANPDSMSTLCPLSCGVCNFNCSDTHESCVSWAQDGQCEENPLMMYKECPISCGVCTPECKDSKKQCSGWAEAGGCNDNPGFMALHCPVTCGVCKESCKDRAADCPGWMAQGECYNNAQFMYHKCPSSCGVCEMGQCVDKNETQCAIWHDSGECALPPPPHALTPSAPTGTTAASALCFAYAMHPTSPHLTPPHPTSSPRIPINSTPNKVIPRFQIQISCAEVFGGTLSENKW